MVAVDILVCLVLDLALFVPEPLPNQTALSHLHICKMVFTQAAFKATLLLSHTDLYYLKGVLLRYVSDFPSVIT